MACKLGGSRNGTVRGGGRFRDLTGSGEGGRSTGSTLLKNELNNRQDLPSHYHHQLSIRYISSSSRINHTPTSQSDPSTRLCLHHAPPPVRPRRLTPRRCPLPPVPGSSSQLDVNSSQACLQRSWRRAHPRCQSRRLGELRPLRRVTSSPARRADHLLHALDLSFSASKFVLENWMTSELFAVPPLDQHFPVADEVSRSLCLALTARSLGNGCGGEARHRA